MRIQRRTLLAAGLTGMAWTATQGLAAASNTRTRFVFHASSTWGDLLDWLVDRSYAPITAELEKRGFPSILIHSSVRGSDTPNEDRASAVVKALQNVTDDIVIVGISNQGNFLPLVAAARPIRRIVYVNAVIPRPGKAFIEVCQTEQVAVPGSYLDKLLKASQSITDDFLKLIHGSNATEAQLKAMRERIDGSSSAHTMVGFYEVCPLKALPKVDNVYVSGSADDQIRPEWEQSAARRVLGVEPVVISDAGHANIFSNAKYAAQLADACVKGL
jgi:Alpha/beta hydrolase family